MSLDTATLVGKPIQTTETGGIGGINTFVMGTGANRPGVGTFLMKREDYDAIASKATWELKLQGPPGTGLTLTVIPCGCVPYVSAVATSPGTSSKTDIVRVVVRDKRVYPLAGGLLRKSYNIAIDNEVQADSQNSGSDWTWAALLSDIGAPTMSSPPAWMPRNIAFDGLPKRQAIDWIAGYLWQVIAYDWRTDTLAYSTPGTYSGYNGSLLLEQGLKYFIGGQNGSVATPRIPRSFDVVFAAPGDNYGPARQYVKNVVVSADSPAALNNVPLHVGGWEAYPDGAAPDNQTELDAVAADMAARAKALMSAPWAEWTLPGIWPLYPDGAIRQVVWGVTADATYTRVHINCQRDYSPFEDLTNAFNTPGNTLMMASSAVGMDAGTGSRFVQNGSGIPRPTARYQVYTPIDDTLKPIWTTARFS